MKKNCIIIFACLAVIACAIYAANVFSTGRSDVLLFAVGGDLEGEQGAATKDIQEIIRASAAYPGKQYSVFLCGSERWGLSELQGGHSYTLRISDGTYKIIHDYGKYEGTTEKALKAFLKMGDDGCDLIFWGHGDDGASGIGADAVFDNDTLTLYEIQSALKGSGKHFRLIGFDACSMATLQTAWVTAPYCDIFCASTENEALSGWNYKSVIPILSDGRELTAERLRGAFREDGMTVLDAQGLLGSKERLCAALNGARSSKTARLSEIFPLEGGDLLLTHWEDGELPTEELMPGLGDVYRAFLTRK